MTAITAWQLHSKGTSLLFFSLLNALLLSSRFSSSPLLSPPSYFYSYSDFVSANYYWEKAKERCRMLNHRISTLAFLSTWVVYRCGHLCHMTTREAQIILAQMRPVSCITSFYCRCCYCCCVVVVPFAMHVFGSFVRLHCFIILRPADSRYFFLFLLNLG